jgi:hypothetical protein
MTFSVYNYNTRNHRLLLTADYNYISWESKILQVQKGNTTETMSSNAHIYFYHAAEILCFKN